MSEEINQPIDDASPNPALTVGGDVIPLTAPTGSDGNQPIALSLDEFCQRLSRKDRRVELIGAFHFDMTRRGKTWAHEADFDTAFHDFTGGKPAKE